MNCEYCGAEIKCGHEKKIARLKAMIDDLWHLLFGWKKPKQNRQPYNREEDEYPE